MYSVEFSSAAGVNCTITSLTNMTEAQKTMRVFYAKSFHILIHTEGICNHLLFWEVAVQEGSSVERRGHILLLFH